MFDRLCSVCSVHPIIQINPVFETFPICTCPVILKQTFSKSSTDTVGSHLLFSVYTLTMVKSGNGRLPCMYKSFYEGAPSAQTWVRSIHKKWHDSFVSFKCWHWEQGKGQGHKLDWLVLSQSVGARDTTSKSPVSFIHCKFILLQILDLESFLQQRVIIGR